MAVTLTKDNFEAEVLGAEVPVVIDFWATWCMPCQMQSPILEEVEAELGAEVKICKVNVDEELLLAMEYSIASIPTLVFMYKGIFQNRTVGVTDKESIIRNVRSIAAKGGSLSI